MNIGWYFCGWVRLVAEKGQATAILNLCMRYGLAYRHWRADTDTGRICFEMTSHTAAKLCRLAFGEEICVSVTRSGGLPHLLKQYRHRVGLLIGAALGCGILIYSSQILWDIRVSGNEAMTSRQVKQELAESGLRIGMPVSALDAKQMELQIQLDSDRISWVSVNMSGTVAYVEIRERAATPEKIPLQPANLVARCEGIIDGLEVYTGIPVVQSGQAVQKGELLVSGVYDSQAVGWRVTRAAGRVLARTVHDFTVSIPWKYEKKEYTGEVILQKKLIFFEKEIKLFKNSSILGSSCDKINIVDTFTLPSGVSLPISRCTERYLAYKYCEATRTHAQAQALAYHELEQQISLCIPDAMLLKKEITTVMTEDDLQIYCTVYALEDIAEIREFSANEIK